MRLLVYPCSMEIGGSQLNAIELAGRMVARGHHVVLFGPDGLLVPMTASLGLEYVVAERPDSWPYPRNGAQLRTLVAHRRIELVHGYEWAPALDLAFGVEAWGRATAINTCMSMSVASVMPRHSPLLVGTQELLAGQADRPGATYLMEPPIDTDRNAPRDVRAARARFGISEKELLSVVACRLSPDLGKLDGVLEAVTVHGRLADRGLPVRLLVVGDGPGRAEIQGLADAVNGRTARPTVTLVGSMVDPTDAYVAADVVLGMGSSLMKGMAFGKPVVVQGEAGFWRPLDEATASAFLSAGWWGHGGHGAADLEPVLARLAEDPSLRDHLGGFGRNLVLEHFSLDRAADHMEAIYEAALQRAPGRDAVVGELARCAWEVAKFETVQFGRRLAPSSTALRPSTLSGAG